MQFEKLNDKQKCFCRFFFRFLKEHKCFSAFQKALLIKKGQTNDGGKWSELIKSCDEHIIFLSFIWGDTEEGYGYWFKTNIDFMNLCELSEVGEIFPQKYDMFSFF
jgi:hypothetical protein